MIILFVISFIYSRAICQQKIKWEDSLAISFLQKNQIEDKIGIIKDTINGKTILIRFVWTNMTTSTPHFEQSFSDDGGKTWDKVLYKNENTGAIDVAFDPQNPNILFASLWEAHRTPWTLSSGGPGSGVYRSTDGGATWKKLAEHGLPKEPYGRIGLAVAANSERVFALIEAKEGGKRHWAM